MKHSTDRTRNSFQIGYATFRCFYIYTTEDLETVSHETVVHSTRKAHSTKVTPPHQARPLSHVRFLLLDDFSVSSTISRSPQLLMYKSKQCHPESYLSLLFKTATPARSLSRKRIQCVKHHGTSPYFLLFPTCFSRTHPSSTLTKLLTSFH